METEKLADNEVVILDKYNKYLNNTIDGTRGTIPEEEIRASDIANPPDR